MGTTAEQFLTTENFKAINDAVLPCIVFNRTLEGYEASINHQKLKKIKKKGVWGGDSVFKKNKQPIRKLLDGLYGVQTELVKEQMKELKLKEHRVVTYSKSLETGKKTEDFKRKLNKRIQDLKQEVQTIHAQYRGLENKLSELEMDKSNVMTGKMDMVRRRRRLVGNHSREELLELCINDGYVPRPN